MYIDLSVLSANKNQANIHYTAAKVEINLEKPYISPRFFIISFIFFFLTILDREAFFYSRLKRGSSTEKNR